MSYLNKFEYILVPRDSYKVIRNCAKCGKKTEFINTNRFRVNANGKRVDVWLIYQCKECRHTYNLTIHERVVPSVIEKEEYDRFLANDQSLAHEYGTDRQLFLKNKAVIKEMDLEYITLKVGREELTDEGTIVIRNPYGVKIRTDKVLSEIFMTSRSSIKKLISTGTIDIKQNFLKDEVTCIAFDRRNCMEEAV